MCTFWAIARAMTRPLTFRAITWPFARLAIASFYVYSLMSDWMYQLIGDRFLSLS